MASHDNLVLIINQLVQGLDKIGDSLSVVKAIGEDVKAMKDEIEIIKLRVVKIEERIGEELPTKSDVSAIREMLDAKLKPLDQIRSMDERMLTIEGSISHLRSIDSETNAEISDTDKSTERKLVSMEETVNKLMISMENATRKSKIEETSNYAFDAIFKGGNVEISVDQRTAWRLRPQEGNKAYGGVLSNIPLRDDVPFEVRIEETIDKWRNEGIALGVIVKKDEAVKKAESIYQCVPGTYCIRSWSDSYKGKSHIYKDRNMISGNAYNLDTRELQVGTTLGVVRRSKGDLHFLLNGSDMGVAVHNVPHRVYAFFDAMFYVSNVTIIN